MFTHEFDDDDNGLRFCQGCVNGILLTAYAAIAILVIISLACFIIRMAS